MIQISSVMIVALMLAPTRPTTPPGESSRGSTATAQGSTRAGTTKVHDTSEVAQPTNTATPAAGIDATTPSTAEQGNTPSIDSDRLPPEFRPEPAPKKAEPRAPQAKGQVLVVEDTQPAPTVPGDQAPARALTQNGQPYVDTTYVDEVRSRSAVEYEAPPELVYLGERSPPKKSALFMLSYRQYATEDGLARRQNWHVTGIELTPLRRYVRLSFITEFGFEGGEAAAHGDRGDVFVMEKVGLGIQYPHWVSPFIEFQGGAGIGRIELFERNDLGILFSLGLDVGAQWSVASSLKLMVAAGWIRPTIASAQEPLDEATYFNRGTFKVGLGF